MSDHTYYLTTPIYYVNGHPHIGHAYTTIAADVLARYHRLRGRSVFLLTGTDEHGQKVLQTAQQRGLSPQAHCDDMVVHWKALWQDLGLSVDRFIRTTDADHVRVVQGVLANLWDQGLIYRSDYSGWYHVGEAGGGTYRPHTGLFDEFVPALRARGLSEAQVASLLADNPARAFAIGVRRLGPAVGS